MFRRKNLTFTLTRFLSVSPSSSVQFLPFLCHIRIVYIFGRGKFRKMMPTVGSLFCRICLSPLSVFTRDNEDRNLYRNGWVNMFSSASHRHHMIIIVAISFIFFFSVFASYVPLFVPQKYIQSHHFLPCLEPFYIFFILQTATGNSFVFPSLALSFLVAFNFQRHPLLFVFFDSLFAWKIFLLYFSIQNFLFVIASQHYVFR